MTRRGHAPSSWVRAGGAVPESQVGSQEEGPVPRPLPRRENRDEGELATGGDLGGEVTWGVGSDGGGGAGGRGSPPVSKFPPGEDEGVMRMANFGNRDSVPPGLSSQSQESRSLSSLLPQTQESWAPVLSCLESRTPKPCPVLSSSRQRIPSGPQILPHQDLGFLASGSLLPKTQEPKVPSPSSPVIILCHCDASVARA